MTPEATGSAPAGAAELHELRSAVLAAAAHLNKRVASLYPLGARLRVTHTGSEMQATVIRHADGCYHAGELLVRSKGGGQQWVSIDRILSVETP
jgi:hypothetical protein